MEGDLQAKGIAHAKAQRQENGTFRETHVKGGGQRAVGQGVAKLDHDQGPNVDPSSENARKPEDNGTLWKECNQGKDSV